MESREEMTLPRRFLRISRGTLRQAKVADSSGAELTGAGLLTRTLILRRLLRREVLDDDEKHVGLLVPPSVGAVVANAAVSLDRRIAVNLNYTVSSEVMNACIRQCEIRHVLTSRRAMEKFDLKIDAQLVYLEDFKDKVTTADKLIAAAQTWLLPAAALERWLGLIEIDPHDVLTVIFTSGSTGLPKGVMLTHRNVGTNIEGFNAVLNLSRSDVLVGILPLFHSFGYTVTLWTALTLHPKGVYHYSPLEARQVGKLCRQHGATLLIATPTFLRSYLRRCQPEDFAAMEMVITGAEKLPVELADAFEKKFGVRPLEGYGTTELSPVVGVNVPPSRQTATTRKGCREGTIGQPLPGVSAKVIDLDTGEDLGVGRSGMLMIKGPNVMKGYLGQPELTAQVIRDGWYETGDVAQIDAEGFIKITGRQSRFSKIGGEMVPHIRIEEELARVLELDEEEEITLAVTAVPDPKKGERLVVLHTGLGQPPQEICRLLSDAGLPPIWIPLPDSFRQVSEIPVLGTGKLDLKRVKEMALEEFQTPEQGNEG
ncbi:MAG: AMP-binding protein [Planctomycetota bacterium]|jgi:acyl-[acyl-carrier-protein]-phospholipid O-acyltransferase/long-chain-fatty-acid--[acyl-carrier-protein] ligase